MSERLAPKHDDEKTKKGQGWFWNAMVIGGMVAVLLVVYFSNPADSRWLFKCPLFQITGWQCPLCGSQRALHAFLHGQWFSAWRYNPMFWFVIPYLGLWLASNISPRIASWKVSACLLSDRGIGALVAILLVWGLVRNLW